MVVSASVSAADGEWISSGTLANFDMESGISVGVVFSPSSNGECKRVELAVVGNSDIYAIGFCADSNCFESRAVYGKSTLS